MTLVTWTMGVEYMGMVRVMFATKRPAPRDQAKEDLNMGGGAGWSEFVLICFCVSS